MNGRGELPTSLKVVAWLFILSGAASLIEVVLALLDRRLDFNFGVLGLFIGPGLLRLSAGWRTVALILLSIAVIGIPILGLLFLGANGPVSVTIFGLPYMAASRQVALVFICVLFAISAWQLGVLTSPEVRQLFNAAPRPEND